MIKLHRYSLLVTTTEDPNGEWCELDDVRANLDAACQAHCTCGGLEREDPRACVACRIWYQMEVR